MFYEIYTPYFFDQIVSPISVSLDSIQISGKAGFNMLLRPLKSQFKIILVRFSDLPIATRITNESQRILSSDKLPTRPIHFINIVEKSNFVAWLNKESLDIYKNDPWIHITIFADDEWVDVITSDYPEILIDPVNYL